MINVKVLVTRLDPELPIPDYAKAGDAGADLRARIDLTIQPGERALVPTGIAIALPAGYAAFVHPRSGLALRSDRIAQLVIQSVEKAEFVEVSSLPGASRGGGGFGSTGRQ